MPVANARMETITLDNCRQDLDYQPTFKRPLPKTKKNAGMHTPASSIDELVFDAASISRSVKSPFGAQLSRSSSVLTNSKSFLLAPPLAQDNLNATQTFLFDPLMENSIDLSSVSHDDQIIDFLNDDFGKDFLMAPSVH